MEIDVLPTVFHPKYFGSSMIFARFIEALGLSGRRFLDMGTGSGIIGLFAARAGADVTSVDVNPEAVRCATENASRAGFKIRACESDLFGSLANERFDVIAWNPPFFPQPANNVAEAALYAGEDHATIRRFAGEARDHLSGGGAIYLIFSLDGGMDAIEGIFRDAGFSLRSVHSERWGLADTMTVLEMR